MLRNRPFVILGSSLLLLAACGAQPDQGEEGDDALAVETDAAVSSEQSNATTVSSVETEGDAGEFEVCDENGNRYPSEADAEAAGLSMAEYGATYCEM